MASVRIVPILDELVEKRRLSKINVFGSAVQEVIPPTLHASPSAFPLLPFCWNFMSFWARLKIISFPFRGPFKLNKGITNEYSGRSPNLRQREMHSLNAVSELRPNRTLDLVEASKRKLPIFLEVVYTNWNVAYTSTRGSFNLCILLQEKLAVCFCELPPQARRRHTMNV